LCQHQVAHFSRACSINPDAALAHCVHHRHQLDLKPVGAACLLLVEYRIETLEQQECVGSVGLGIRSDEARGQSPDLSLWIKLLTALWNQTERIAALQQQPLVLAGKAAPFA